MEKETWKDVLGWEGFYEISNTGVVASKEREVSYGSVNYIRKRQKIKQWNDFYGYKIVTLCAGGKRGNIRVHRIFAEAYIPNPENKPLINHKDGDKANNDIKNLEWSTYSENIKHGYTKGLNTGMRGKANINKRISIDQYDLKGSFIRNWSSGLEAAKHLKLAISGISLALNGKRKHCGGFIWKLKKSGSFEPSKLVDII